MHWTILAAREEVLAASEEEDRGRDLELFNHLEQLFIGGKESPRGKGIPGFPVHEDRLRQEQQQFHHRHHGLVAPSLIRTQPKSGAVIIKEAGDVLRLECLVDGMPVPTISWYKVPLESLTESEKGQTAVCNTSEQGKSSPRIRLFRGLLELSAAFQDTFPRYCSRKRGIFIALK